MLPLLILACSLVAAPLPLPLPLAPMPHPAARRPDCGCAYSLLPKGFLGSRCGCNPTGNTPCVCGDDYGDQRPVVEIRRGVPAP